MYFGFWILMGFTLFKAQCNTLDHYISPAQPSLFVGIFHQNSSNHPNSETKRNCIYQSKKDVSLTKHKNTHHYHYQEQQQEQVILLTQSQGNMIKHHVKKGQVRWTVDTITLTNILQITEREAVGIEVGESFLPLDFPS